MTLNIRDMKKIIHDIIDEELGNHRLSAKVMPFTFVEYSGRRTLRKITILEKASKWLGAIW